ncbi:MAG: cytochrome c [Pseudomonadota bacterium]
MTTSYLRHIIVTGVIAGLAAACQNSTPTDNFQEIASSDNGEMILMTADLIDQGRSIAERNCATCHSIGVEGDSPREGAPPLRYVLADLGIEALAIDFREHVQLGNEVMPEFNFGPLGTDALMAYLLSIDELS